MRSRQLWAAAVVLSLSFSALTRADQPRAGGAAAQSQTRSTGDGWRSVSGRQSGTPEASLVLEEPAPPAPFDPNPPATPTPAKHNAAPTPRREQRQRAVAPVAALPRARATARAVNPPETRVVVADHQPVAQQVVAPSAQRPSPAPRSATLPLDDKPAQVPAGERLEPQPLTDRVAPLTEIHEVPIGDGFSDEHACGVPCNECDICLDERRRFRPHACLRHGLRFLGKLVCPKRCCNGAVTCPCECHQIIDESEGTIIEGEPVLMPPGDASGPILYLDSSSDGSETIIESLPSGTVIEGWPEFAEPRRKRRWFGFLSRRDDGPAMPPAVSEPTAVLPELPPRERSRWWSGRDRAEEPVLASSPRKSRFPWPRFDSSNSAPATSTVDLPPRTATVTARTPTPDWSPREPVERKWDLPEPVASPSPRRPVIPPVPEATPAELVTHKRAGDDFATRQTGWQYPSREVASTVPVPDYQPRSDARPPGPQWQDDGRDRDVTQTAARPRVPTLSSVRPRVQDAVAPDANAFHASPFDSPCAAPVPPPWGAGTTDPCALGPPPGLTCPPGPCGFGGYPYTWDNIELFASFEAFEQSGADDERVAGRFGGNWGLPIIDDACGLGFQIGGSGSVAEDGSQAFATGGVFFRGDMRYGVALHCGAVVDYMHDRAFDSDVTQVRPKASVTLDERNELGVWGAFGVKGDETNAGVDVEAVDQASLFYRYLWPTGWDLSGWVGWRDDRDSLAVGADVALPLDDWWSVKAGGFYGFESHSWNAFAGFSFYPSRKARERFIGQYRHMPYLPVANNTSMTLVVGK